jgi:hypothetical protein
MKTTHVWKLPCRSQEFNEGPLLRPGPDRLAIAYDCETESGDYAWDEMTFTGLVAFTFTAAEHCTPEHVAAYDEVQEVLDSQWGTNLRGVDPNVHHYRMYFDDVGCYEVLAAAFVPPPPPKPV